MDSVFTIPTVIEKFHLLTVVLVFELVLRILERTTRDSNGHARYPLLSPIYFCSITPMFYAALWIFNVNLNDAMEAGYFFPILTVQNAQNQWTKQIGSIFNEHLLDMWNVINLPTVSMTAIFDAIPTMTALILFSLIQVPINIPAFAISSNTEVDIPIRSYNSL
jgi:sulfate permease, SulP family